jgi:hypothetical protein
MHDPTREYGECILCGGTPTTHEHIFGDAIASELDVKQNWRAPAASFDQDLNGKTVAGKRPITETTSKVFCRSCNGDLLGPHMQRVTPLVVSLANGNRCAFNGSQISEVKRYAERIWIIKDVESSSVGIDEVQQEKFEYRRSSAFRHRPPVLTASERKAWAAGEQLPKLRLFIGFHAGALGINPEGNTTSDPPMHRWKLMVVVVGNIAFLGLLGQVPRSLRDKISNAFVSVDRWDGAWPRTDLVTYDDYFSLHRQDSRVRSVRLGLKDPKYVADYEARVRAGQESQNNDLKL